MTDAASADAAARIRKIKFREGNHAGFYRTLKRRASEHLAATGKSRFAGRELAMKAALYGALVVGAYGALIANVFADRGALLLLAVVFGLATLLLSINVAHDAAHDAVSRHRWVNRCVQATIFTLLGANAYLWRLRHVKSHHTFPNVNGCDIDIDHNAWLRLSPNQPRRPHHRFQHLYAPLIFWLVNVHTVFYQDVVYLFKKRLANMSGIAHPPREHALFVLGKALYIAIVFVIPWLVLGLAWWEILLGVAIMTFVNSVVFVTLLIGTHFAMESEFPEVDAGGRIAHDWAVHALKTSVDWSPTGRLANFIAGGANAHAAHHLFPNICHTHYRALTPIVARTAAEFGIRHNVTTLPRLVVSHWRFLRAMGRGDALAPSAAPAGIPAAA